MTGSAALSMRADLIHRRIWMGNHPVWVVKDPLSQGFFYFTEQEHRILSLADGRRCLAEIAGECSTRMAPHYIASESLVRFFADARRNGLVVVDGVGTGPSDVPGDARRWWHHPLAIRLPGFSPDRFLDLIHGWLKPACSCTALVLAVCLMTISLLLVVRNFDALAQHATAAARLGHRSWLILLVTLSITKIIHELAHGLVCKHFGGQCRELGVMLLVGVPCLYCDVSDAWLLRHRWQRILVSAAGMLAELTLASIATLIWVFTTDGLLRDICVTVMVVCSVSTVLFNGNPLLRYDGYYILSDLVGIPNLAGQAAAAIGGWCRRRLWATPAPRNTSPTTGRDLLVVGYGIASGAYRAAVYMLILFMLYQLARQHELGEVAGLVLLLAVLAYFSRWAKSVLTPPDRAVRRASLSSRRPAMIVAATTLAVVVIGLIPLPRSVTAPMSIQPAGAVPVFVTSEGAIAEAIIEGADVRAGQRIARLRNRSIQREVVATQSLCDRLAVQLDSLRRRRSANRELSAQIPELEETLAEARKRAQWKQQVAGQLTLTSPRDGRLFPPPAKLPSETDHRLPTFWTGTPLAPANRGAWLAKGTMIGVVGDRLDREAVVMLRQQEIEGVRRGQSVALLLADHRRHAVTGRVLEVAVTPSPELPSELESSGMLELRSAGTPSPPYYRVRVLLDRQGTPLPVRLTGQARISVGGASIFTRIHRFLSDSLG